MKTVTTVKTLHSREGGGLSSYQPPKKTRSEGGGSEVTGLHLGSNAGLHLSRHRAGRIVFGLAARVPIIPVAVINVHLFACSLTESREPLLRVLA